MLAPRLLPTLLLCLVAGLPAQQVEGRLATAFLGGARDAIVWTEGTTRRIHDPALATVGDAALEVRPAAADRFYGVTIDDLPAYRPKSLVVLVHNPASKAVRWDFRLNDDPQPGVAWDRVVIERQIPPGRSLQRVRLDTTSGVKTGRSLDFSHGIGRFRLSRPKRTMEDPGLVFDALWFEGEERPKDALKELDHLIGREPDLLRSLENADGPQKNPIRSEYRQLLARIRGTLVGLPEKTRVGVAVKLLGRDMSEAARRALRQSLTGLRDADALESLAAALKRGDMRASHLELRWAAASAENPAWRAAAIGWVSDRKLGAAARTAVLKGLTRDGDAEFSGIAARIQDNDPWTLRATLAQAAARAPAEAGVPTLIQMLREGGSVRVLHDAVGALIERSGTDFGFSADAWADWWKANRGRLVRGKTPPEAGYHRFYGVPIIPGRMVFVLDLSGSMRDPIVGGAAQRHVETAAHLKGKRIRTRLDLAQAELAHAISGLDPKSHVGVVTYSTSAGYLGRGLMKANKSNVKSLVKRVTGLGAGGATNIHAGLDLAFHPKGKPRKQDLEDGPDTIFLVTDGDPSAGPITEREGLRDLVLRWNLGRAIKIHTINVGPGDRKWMRELSLSSGGTFLDLTTAGTPRRNTR